MRRTSRKTHRTLGTAKRRRYARTAGTPIGHCSQANAVKFAWQSTSPASRVQWLLREKKVFVPFIRGILGQGNSRQGNMQTQLTKTNAGGGRGVSADGPAPGDGAEEDERLGHCASLPCTRIQPLSMGQSHGRCGPSHEPQARVRRSALLRVPLAAETSCLQLPPGHPRDHIKLLFCVLRLPVATLHGVSRRT